MMTPIDTQVSILQLSSVSQLTFHLISLIPQKQNFNLLFKSTRNKLFVRISKIILYLKIRQEKLKNFNLTKIEIPLIWDNTKFPPYILLSHISSLIQQKPLADDNVEAQLSKQTSSRGIFHIV